MLEMEFSQLVTLVHVAETGSLSRASERLNIVQPALSRQIRLLEQELGVTLFDRHGRGMTLTTAGQEALEHAGRVLADMESLRRAVEGGEASLKGFVSIGTTPTVAEIVTVPLMRRIRREHPELTVRFSAAFSGHVVDWLKRGEVDIAFSYDPPPTRALRVEHVMDEELCLISASRSHAVSALPFAALTGVRMVLPSPRHGLRAIIDDCAKTAGVTFTQLVEADYLGALVDLTSEGLGDTILPLAPLRGEIEAGRLVAIPLTDPTPRRRLAVCYAMDRPISPAARYVGGLFVEIARDLVGDGRWPGQMLAADAAAASTP